MIFMGNGNNRLHCLNASCFLELFYLVYLGHPKEYRSSESCQEVSTCDPWDIKGGLKAEVCTRIEK